jgi:hypothetical protein
LAANFSRLSIAFSCVSLSMSACLNADLAVLGAASLGAQLGLRRSLHLRIQGVEVRRRSRISDRARSNAPGASAHAAMDAG